MLYKSRYGYFTDDMKEYVITEPETPRPWINVISNGDYSFILSQSGGGFSFRGNAEQNRLTRSFQDIVRDNWGKYYYIKDEEQNTLWSAAYMPIKDGVDFYEVRHGIGYSVIVRESHGIHSELTMLVSPDKPMELHSLSVSNLSSSHRKLSVTSYFEWAPGIAYDNHREFQRLFAVTRFDERLNCAIIDKHIWGFPDSKGRHNNDEWEYTGFFGCSEEVDSFDFDKESFIGMYRDQNNPIGLVGSELKGNYGRYGDPVCALRCGIDLECGETKTLVFGLGMAANEYNPTGTEDYESFLDAVSVDGFKREMLAVEKMWEGLIMGEKATTPDPAFNIMVNYWAKYQAISGRLWAKAAYYQISGGIGFRDQLQDSLVWLETHSERTKQQILLHSSKQFNEGDVQHWWLTIKSWGPRTKCSDDFLWLPFATAMYIQESGDYSVLGEVTPYLDGGEGTVYDHCKRALELCFKRKSPRGVTLMGDHDWNDGLSAVGNGMKGESFWLSEFVYYIIKRFVGIAAYVDDNAFVERLNSEGECIRKAFNEYGWDGEWFLQATTDDGEKLGSAQCDEGKVFLNPQLWAVISDITCEERKKSAMDAVTKYLLKEHGALLLSPEYTSPRTDVGYITRYAPGLRENGGVYTHAATWAVWAYALMGDNEKAYRAFKAICPPLRSADIDCYKSEPYVLCGNSDGPISPYFGKGGWSWYTGSAQWLHGVAVHSILGINPTASGLCVKPCLPDEWSGYEYERMFRGAKYKIICKNGKTGTMTLTVDGKLIDGNVIPDFGTGEHLVEVQL